jgi:hypothetical protein
MKVKFDELKLRYTTRVEKEENRVLSDAEL